MRLIIEILDVISLLLEIVRSIIELAPLLY